MNSMTADMMRQEISRLEKSIQIENRNLIQELKIEIDNGMLIIYGKAASYYGKQIVQETIMKNSDILIRANRIKVHERD